MIHINVVGPESTGKSTLVECLRHKLNLVGYGTETATEFGRDYVTRVPFDTLRATDYAAIALGQLGRLVDAMERSLALAHLYPRGGAVVADTDVLTTYLWAQQAKREPRGLREMATAMLPPTLTLLCAPTVPWIDDGLRVQADARQRYQMYIDLDDHLHKLGAPYVRLTQYAWDERTDAAWNAILPYL
jgi:NadR type nicotinamide-nucleotide adenylyltransferase